MHDTSIHMILCIVTSLIPFRSKTGSRLCFQESLCPSSNLLSVLAVDRVHFTYTAHMFLVGRYGSRKAQACHGFGRSRVLDHRSFLFPFLNWTIVQTWHWANVYLRSERDRAARAPCHSLVPRPTFRKTVRHADALSSLRRRALTQQRWNTSQNFSTFPQKTETKFY
jgi:hypothetical protein